MFSPEERDRIKEQLIEKAHADPRVVAAAAVGGTAERGDRWSDLDLTFGIADAASVERVLTDWTQTLEEDLAAAILFDLPVRSSIYRVFLLPGMLQVDLSFTPAADFGARGPRFHLLFGDAVEHPPAPLPSPDDLFGRGIHHVVRAHICIQRGRLWQAEYWLHEARDEALTLACRRLGLEISHGRGFDSLPPGVRERFSDCLPATLTVHELGYAVASVTEALLQEASDSVQVVVRARPIVEELLRLA